MSKESKAVWRRRRVLKMKAIEYRGSKCSICGYSKCIGALQFHHLDRSTKEFGISKEGYSKSWKTLKEELDKCILVCANCHSELHFSDVESKIIPKIKVEKKQCLRCGKKLDYPTKNTLCRKCYTFSRRKVVRPSKEELIIEKNSSSYKKMGMKYGVSDKTIRGWIFNNVS
jgi:ribosomal protein L40E